MTLGSPISSQNNAVARRQSTVTDQLFSIFLFHQQHTCHDVGTEEHVVWKNHVDQQDFLLFTGANTHTISFSGIYTMFDDGLNSFTAGLLLTA